MPSSSHPNEIQLLNYSTGMQLESDLESHIVQCSACQEKLELLEQEQSDLQASSVPDQTYTELLERYQHHQVGQSLLVKRWALGFAAACALILVGAAMIFLTRSDSPSNGIRLKGEPGVKVYVKRGEQVREADAGFLYRQGDRLRLGIIVPESMVITVLAEEHGALAPISGLTGVVIAPHHEVVLPGSLLVECDAGVERLEIQFATAQGERDPKDMVKSKSIQLRCQ
jgi:hypothetical protein